MVELLGAADIRELAARLDVTPTKKLGQNFVTDPNTIRRIVAAAKLGEAESVVEIGPGLGSLTLGLLEVAASLALQRMSFEEHIRIAKENDIALMIHDREAHDEVLETLERVGAPEKVVLHCYSGDLDFAKKVAERGWYLSFAGNITIKRNQHLRDALEWAPKELLLVETDAPFLTPEPFRGTAWL